MTKAEFLNMLDTNDSVGILRCYLIEMNPSKTLNVVEEIITMLNKNPINMSMVIKASLNHYCLKVQLSFLIDENGQTIKRW